MGKCCCTCLSINNSTRLGNAKAIEKHCNSHVVEGVTYQAAKIRSPGFLTRCNQGHIVLLPTTTSHLDIVEEVAALLNECGIKTRLEFGAAGTSLSFLISPACFLLRFFAS